MYIKKTGNPLYCLIIIKMVIFRYLLRLWASNKPTPIVLDMLEKYGISKDVMILELGCGEGRIKNI